MLMPSKQPVASFGNLEILQSPAIAEVCGEVGPKRFATDVTAAAVRCVCSLMLVMLCSQTLTAQEPTPNEQSSAPAEGDVMLGEQSLKPQTERLKAASEAMRSHVLEMREIVIRFDNSTNPSQDSELKRRFVELQTTGHAKYAELLAAALAEFQQGLDNQSIIADWLYNSLNENVENDEFEGMLPIAKALMEVNYPEDELLLRAGLTAFAMNDFDTAQKWIQQIVDTQRASPTFISINEEIGDLQREWEAELAIRAEDAAGEPLPRVLMHTTKGDVEIELFENQAPETVGHFIHLVEDGFYERLTFHRVLNHYMAQTGCPNGDGSGDAGYSIYNESMKPNARKFFRGTIGIALAQEPDTGGSQFFITYLPTPQLNNSFTAFGRVTKGMEIVANLNEIDPENKDEKKGPALLPDEILSIEVLSKRDHEYLPNKVPKNPSENR